MEKIADQTRRNEKTLFQIEELNKKSKELMNRIHEANNKHNDEIKELNTQ
jgi:hypothetical protein